MKELKASRQIREYMFICLFVYLLISIFRSVMVLENVYVVCVNVMQKAISKDRPVKNVQ